MDEPLESIQLKSTKMASEKEVETLGTNTKAPLSDDYVFGPWAASAINFEVRKIFNVVNSKRRNVKVLRKCVLTKNEIKKMPDIVKNIQNVSRKNE